MNDEMDGLEGWREGGDEWRRRVFYTTAEELMH